ncbi:MAG: succinoglycan biosynthesis protein ExoA [Actinomycetota bacterium]|jgi:glycosyltransferase involved in cell wall biosynthesis
MEPYACAVPSVSIVLPTLNERGFIRDCLDSLLAQDYADIVEILVVDGGSTDGTRELSKAIGGAVRLVDNPRVTAAAAMNIGIEAATGDVVCRADAHTLYLPDYVSRCVGVLDETGAANVGGPMRAVGTTNFGRAVAAVTSSPFGVGPGRFHYSKRREQVDTVYLGCWKRSTLVELGGYDESRLQWAAEDQELNFRIRQSGGTIVLDPKIRSWYFPRSTVRALWRQYSNYGVAKASTLAKHRSLPTWRPLVPAALVGATALGLVFGRGPARIAIPALHTATAAVVATRLARDPGVAPHRAFVALAICHWGYGSGFWAGLTRIVRRRAFVNAPSGHR